MRVAYLDCFAGISGELLLGALLDAGLSIDTVRSELARLPITGYTLEAQQIVLQGVSGTQVVVRSSVSPYVPPGRTGHSYSGNGSSHDDTSPYADIIARADLPEEVKRTSLAVLKLLGESEEAIAGSHHSPNLSGDYLRDVLLVVAAVHGLALLGVQRVICSPFNVGGGIVRSGQSALPIPGPTVARILHSAQAPIYGTEANRELVTPVGAALAVTLASSFGQVPTMPLGAIGYSMAGIPVVPSMRVLLGELRSNAEPAMPGALATAQGQPADKSGCENPVTVLEVTLDDTNPQYYDFIVERLLWQGALEVFVAPVQMKMNRSGVVLSVICDRSKIDVLSQTIFEETSAEHLRIAEVQHRSIKREITKVPTRWGPVNVKIGRNAEGRLLHVKPDYEDVKRVALEQNVPVERVYEEARSAWSPFSPDTHQQPGRQRFAPAASATA